MKKVSIPIELLDLPTNDRTEIVRILLKHAQLPLTMELPKSGTADEHNIWTRNNDPLIGENEDDFYYTLATEEQARLHDLMVALGLPAIQKALDPDYEAFEDEVLVKAKNSGRTKMSDYINGLSKKAKERIVKWTNDGKALTKEQLRKMDTLLSAKLPNYVKIAERYSLRAGLIAKVHNKEAEDALDLAGAYLDRIPESITLAEKEEIVLNIRQKNQAQRTVRIEPLTPMEADAVRHASMHAGEKLTEISERHIAGVKQLVLRAKKERWTAEQLASKLFDRYNDHNRDWRRVAITELAYAHNDGFLAGCIEGDTLIGMGSVNACVRCKGLIIGKSVVVTHTVPERDTYHTDTNVVWVGKSNYGRKVAEYITAIPLHPNCRCRWHKYSRFYKVVDGKLVLKDTAELINEERAKRGLAPDKELEGLSQEERLQKMTERLLSKQTDEG